jgi:hypothetical protein
MPLADSHSSTSIWACAIVWNSIFLSIFNTIYKIFSFYLIMSMSEINIFENWKIFFCLFWKQTWATGYISMKHAWINACQCLFQYMLQAGYSPGWSVVNGKNEKTEWKWKKWKNTNEKLAKLKTRKGGLGKNEHPADWQPMKAIQAKMKEWNIEKHWPQMRTSNVYPALTRLATVTCIQELSKGPPLTSFIVLSHGFDASQWRYLQRGFPLWICCSTSHYVPNLPMFRLPLWSFSDQLPINHAFQAFIHA